MKPKLVLNNISKTFYDPQELKTLDHVSITLHDGELVSILGPSGCGKSTLLEIIAGLYVPDEGEILLDGEDLTGQKGRVSYMTQNDIMFPWRKVIDNVIIPLELQGIKKNIARKEALSHLKTFGLEKFAHAYPATLSGGMRQRASLLRTYLCKKDIMLLDEPFGRLDALTKIQLQQWFLEIWEHAKKSVLFVTHDIDEAIFLSDRIYILSALPGTVAAEIAIPLKRPRSLQITTHPDFMSIKKKILEFFKLG